MVVHLQMLRLDLQHLVRATARGPGIVQVVAQHRLRKHDALVLVERAVSVHVETVEGGAEVTEPPGVHPQLRGHGRGQAPELRGAEPAPLGPRVLVVEPAHPGGQRAGGELLRQGQAGARGGHGGEEGLHGIVPLPGVNEQLATPSTPPLELAGEVPCIAGGRAAARCLPLGRLHRQSGYARVCGGGVPCACESRCVRVKHHSIRAACRTAARAWAKMA
mmetsp:Transcript_80756/g.217022  ORF Transcript_80756/g.217022 Transcript_80756/m.217022 type:complete len:219 (-) Transcript_80756:8-664(-)